MDILEGYVTEKWKKIPKNVCNRDLITYKQCMKPEGKNDMRIVKTGEGDKVFLKSYVWSRTYRCYNVRRNDSEKADVNARDGSEKAASAQVKEGLGTLESVGQHG